MILIQGLSRTRSVPVFNSCPPDYLGWYRLMGMLWEAVRSAQSAKYVRCSMQKETKKFTFLTCDLDGGRSVELAISENGDLYVDGNKVKTETLLRLGTLERKAVIAGGFATFGVFVLEIIKMFGCIQ